MLGSIKTCGIIVVGTIIGVLGSTTVVLGIITTFSIINELGIIIGGLLTIRPT